MKLSRTVLMLIFATVFFIHILTSCTMFTAWRSIPAPGGCEECHKVPITANWQVSYKPAMLTDERNRVYFQTEEYNKPAGDKPMSAVDKQKVEEMTCFECHNAPNAAHKTMKGKFHH